MIKLIFLGAPPQFISLDKMSFFSTFFVWQSVLFLCGQSDNVSTVKVVAGVYLFIPSSELFALLTNLNHLRGVAFGLIGCKTTKRRAKCAPTKHQ
jgi:hypothetical protein